MKKFLTSVVYLLCGYNTDGSDRVSPPSYVNSSEPITFDGDGHTSTFCPPDTVFSTFGSTYQPADPRALVSPTSLSRSIGFWQQGGDTPQIVMFVNLSEAKQFNLSIYIAATDQGLVPSEEVLTNGEQGGHDITLLVQDLAYPTGQGYRCMNVAGGCWVTFPVSGDPDNPIQVTVTGNDFTKVAAVMGICFDPYYNRQTVLTYNTAGLVREIRSARPSIPTVRWLAVPTSEDLLQIITTRTNIKTLLSLLMPNRAKLRCPTIITETF